MLKKILRKRVIIPLIIILIASSIGIYVYRYYKNSITGEDRFLCEMMFMDELAEITEQLDTTISLYYNGNLNEDAYITQMQMIDDEMLIFMDRKKKFDDNVVVRLNTNTLASKKGTEAAHNIFDTFDGLVDSCMNETYYKDKNKLIYMYIAKKNQIKNEMVEYSQCATAEIYKKYKDNKEKYDELLEQNQLDTETTEE